jgi:hypothetical protein
MRSLITSDGDLPSQLKVVGPSVCCNVPNFEIWDVMNSNWLTDNGEYVHTVTVQHYPTNNCKINGNIIDPETIFSSLFLTHESAINLTAPYIDTANQVVAQGKEMVMLEFNTASCGGFAGLSDSFGAALWMADWALQLAWGNFSNALMHVGGQSVYYNPFTPPPYAYTGAGWTTGSVYYSSLVIAEALGSTNTSQVVDYSQDRADDSHPAYLIYENGSPARVVLFNYLSDTTGAADYVATIQVPGLNIDHVTVRYLSAPTISEQYDIYWGNLTMGKSFEGDGRLHGTDVTSVFGCTDNACNVNVPGPSIALVFLTEDAMSEVAPDPAQDVAFSTTVLDVNGVAVNKTAAESGNGSPDWTSLYNGGGSLEIGLALVSAAVVMTLVIGW